MTSNPVRPYIPFGGGVDKLDDVKFWHKFGQNPVVEATEEDIWTTGGTETLPTSGVTMWIACTDNTNGVGQVIRVDGLDESWTYKTEFVTLAGQTPVQIGDASSWTRIHRAYQVSASPDPVGDVYIAEDDTDFSLGVPQTASNIHGFIDFTNASQQTLKCMLTVPAGHEALLYGFNAQIGTPSGAARTVNVFIEVQELARGATVGSPSWAPFRRIDEHSLISDAQSSAAEEYNFPLGPFPQLTNIHARATASASSIVVADMSIITYKV